MSDVAEPVTCALCGTQMSAGTQFCPKCGSLNAHFGYPKPAFPAATPPAMHPAATPSPVDGAIESNAPAPGPSARGRKAHSAVRVVHATRRDVQEDRQLPSPLPHMPSAGQYPRDQSAPPPEANDVTAGVNAEASWVPPAPHVRKIEVPSSWQTYSPDNSDVELPATWRDGGLVRIRPRPLPPQRQSTGVPDADTARMLEFFGFIGTIGLGHIYGGRAVRGLVLMVGWWVVLAVLVLPVLGNLTPFTLITTFFTLCLGPALSGSWIANDLRQRTRSGPQNRPPAGGGGPWYER